MARLLVLILLLAATALGAMWMSERPGSVRIEWLGWEASTTMAFFFVAFIVATVVFSAAWGILGWLINLPNLIGKAHRAYRRNRGQELFAQGFIAAEGGDGARARKILDKAHRFLDDQKLLTLLMARANEANGDLAAAESAYVVLLGDPKTELLARRGLAAAAHARRDATGAAEHAAAALKLSRSAAWAFAGLFDFRLNAGDWRGALEALEEGERRKFITGAPARRRRAVLLTAAGVASERAGELATALDFATRAAKAAPGFAPGAVLGARMAKAVGDAWKAQAFLEAAWEEAPHPALARLYAELKGGETATELAQRMRVLVEVNPGHRESRIIAVEQAIALQNWEEAAAALDGLIREGMTSRTALLKAAIAAGRKDSAGERVALAAAATAPREPDWTDIDPDGPSFSYADQDWARLVHVYGDSGELIHPRYERFRRDALTGVADGLLPAPERGVREAAFAPVAAGPTGQVARLPNLRPVETVAPAEEDDDLDDDEGKRGFVSWFRRR
jgi:HemY protein